MQVETHDAEGWLGDPVAFRAFYAESLPVVFSFLYHRVGGRRAVAEDLTQETFMAVVRDIKARTQVDAAIPWVMGIARHKLLDHYRHEEREERRLALAFSAQPDDIAPDPEHASYADTLEALGRIPAAQRAALALRYLDGLSVVEVAHALDRSIHATESLLARGRVSFRDQLEEVRRG